MSDERHYVSVGVAALRLGLHRDRIRNYAIDNKVRSYRTKGGHRRVCIEDFDINSDIPRQTEVERRRLCYARVSSKAQKDDLSRQKSLGSKKTSPNTKSSETLGLASTSKGAVFVPFWNSQCKENSKKSWLPIETVSVDSHSTCSSGLSLPKEPQFELSIQMDKMTMEDRKMKSSKTSSQSSLSLGVVSTVNEAAEEEESDIRSMKVKLRPKLRQRQIFTKIHHALRALWNLALEHIKKGNVGTHFAEMKKYFLGPTRKALNRVVEKKRKLDDEIESLPYHMRGDTLRRLGAAYKSAFSNKKAGTVKKFEMRFQSRRDKRGFGVIPVQKCMFAKNNAFDDNFIFLMKRYRWRLDADDKAKPFGPLRYKRQGSKKRNRKLPKIKKDCKIVYEEPGRWYLIIPYQKKREKLKPAPFKDATLDPGARDFQTLYSNDAKLCATLNVLPRTTGSEKRGKFKSYNMLDLAKRIDQIRSSRDGDEETGSRIHRKKTYKRKEQMLRAKMKNKLKDAHDRIIRFLLDNFQEIRVGKLGVKRILESHKLHLTAKRKMQMLSHCRFHDRLIQNHGHVRNTLAVPEE